MQTRLLNLRVLLLTVASTAGMVNAQWTQWGGPHADFITDSKGLAQEWSSDGPKKLWSRSLGEGYSAILVDDGNLYTMYRGDSKERVVCLNSKSGETVWEHGYDSAPRPGHVMEFGDGPRATPLIVGDRLYTIGVAGQMHCFDKKTGKPIWSHDLWTEFDGNVLNHGYSSSPFAYKDTVIVLVGGKDQSIVAFKQTDGSVAWKNQSFANSYATPRILKILGEDQLVTFMATEVIGVDPNNGELKWSFPHENTWKQNISAPILIDDILFISSPDAGAKGLKLAKEGGKFTVTEKWSSRKVQFYHVTTVQRGEYVYGSTGTQSPAFMMGINAKTGELKWRERGFSKANCLWADGRLVILDEDGNLALATAKPEGLTVHSKAKVAESVSWTVPTLVGKTLYLRDKKTITALDLG
ncbi:MAG: PQQ-binding-like beta-propeller repeat protein [Planctomycetota bacterium]